MNTKLTFLWGFIIFFVSATLFSLSDNSVVSAFYIFIAMFCGIFLIVFRKDIPVFSPVFMLFSSVFINIGFPSLYILMGKVSFSEEMLKNIAIVYLIYFFAVSIPVFFANQMFLPSDSINEKPKGIFTINFGSKNITFYLVMSNLLLIFLILFLFKITGFSYIEALKNPLSFRFAASAGTLAYARKLLVFLLMINTFLLAKYNFQNKEKFLLAIPPKIRKIRNLDEEIAKALAPQNNQEENQEIIEPKLYKETNPFKLKIFTFFHVLVLLVFAIVSGSRSVFFLPIVAAIVIYTFYNRVNLKTLISFVLLFVLTLTFMSFYSIYRNSPKNFNISRAPQYVSEEIGKVNVFNETVKRLDCFKNSLYFFEYIDREYNTIFYFKDFHAVDQIKNHILQPFPRNIVSEKGYYFSSLMTEKVFNQDLNEVKITYNFGGISNAFWNFGVAGVILEGLFLGIAVVWLHRKFLRFINYDSFFLFFMVMFFFIPNSIIVDGFWNTMDGCGYFLNLVVLCVIIGILSFNLRFKRS